MPTEDQKPDDTEVIIAPDDAAKTEAPDKNVASEDQLATLKAQLAAAAEREKAHNERADNATRDALNARTEQQRAVEGQFYAQDVAVANAMTAAQGEAQSLEQDIERLATEGKAREMAEAVRKLARAENKIVEAERQKQWLEEQRTGFAAQQEADRQRQAQAARVAQQQPQYSDRAKSWVDAHPLMNSDASYRDAAIGAHNIAKRRGIPVDSDEYFEFIETELGERQPVEAGTEDQPATRPRMAVSAPPSRSTPTGQRQDTRRVLTLSNQEREMADVTMGHITDPAARYKQYALNKQKMLRDNPLQ